MLQERVSRFHYSNGKRNPLGSPTLNNVEAEKRKQHFEHHHLRNRDVTILSFTHKDDKIQYATFSGESLTEYEITGEYSQMKPIIDLAKAHQGQIRKLSV